MAGAPTGRERGVAGQGPVRTCVGCRQRAPQASLLRVAAVNGRPTADPRRRMAGRGAYVHPRSSCVALASSRGGFARAFRARVVSELAGADGFVAQDSGSEVKSSPGASI